MTKFNFSSTKTGKQACSKNGLDAFFLLQWFVRWTDALTFLGWSVLVTKNSRKMHFKKTYNLVKQ